MYHNTTISSTIFNKRNEKQTNKKTKNSTTSKEFPVLPAHPWWLAHEECMLQLQSRELDTFLRKAELKGEQMLDFVHLYLSVTLSQFKMNADVAHFCCWSVNMQVYAMFAKANL